MERHYALHNVQRCQLKGKEEKLLRTPSGFPRGNPLTDQLVPLKPS